MRGGDELGRVDNIPTIEVFLCVGEGIDLFVKLAEVKKISCHDLLNEMSECALRALNAEYGHDLRLIPRR